MLVRSMLLHAYYPARKYFHALLFVVALVFFTSGELGLGMGRPATARETLAHVLRPSPSPRLAVLPHASTHSASFSILHPTVAFPRRVMHLTAPTLMAGSSQMELKFDPTGVLVVLSALVADALLSNYQARARPTVSGPGVVAGHDLAGPGPFSGCGRPTRGLPQCVLSSEDERAGHARYGRGS